jgi:hypothetical protein
MSAQQQRWFCPACLREWLYARSWSPESGCPACQCDEIRLVPFRPAYPGADLPREEEPMPPGVVAVTVVSAPASLALQEEEPDKAFMGYLFI